MEVSQVNITMYDELTKLSFVLSLTNPLVALLLSQTSGDPHSKPHPLKNASSLSKKTHHGKLYRHLKLNPPKIFQNKKSPRRFMRVIQASKRPWHTLSFKGAAISLASEICCGTSGRKVAGERSFFGCWRCLLKKNALQKKAPLKRSIMISTIMIKVEVWFPLMVG